jgi:hypothetical protein
MVIVDASSTSRTAKYIPCKTRIPTNTDTEDAQTIIFCSWPAEVERVGVLRPQLSQQRFYLRLSFGSHGVVGLPSGV